MKWNGGQNNVTPCVSSSAPQHLSFSQIGPFFPPLPTPSYFLFLSQRLSVCLTVTHSFTYSLYSPFSPLFLFPSSFRPEYLLSNFTVTQEEIYHLHCCPAHRNVLTFVYKYKFIVESFMHQDLPILNMTHSSLSHSIQFFTMLVATC